MTSEPARQLAPRPSAEDRPSRTPKIEETPRPEAAQEGSLLQRIVAWFRRLNRARLERRHARRGPKVTLPPSHSYALADALPADAPPGAPPTSVFGHASWVIEPASHAEAWGAYERLQREFARLRRARLVAFQPVPCEMIRAPEDLEAFAREIALPAVESPRVSIVVPAFNHVRETLECVAAVARHTPSRDYELIVVDDASSDATADLLPRVANLRHLRNGENAGFAVSCTRGAKAARGEYLLFLNNDAQVTEGWLEPLLGTFSAFPRVGAVGPKILYPNGRLQEAGAMVNPDMSITMVGGGDDPTLARYNYAREVHYCSGACVVVERRRFEELGGFAPELRPAYYEDCDLQLRLRELGLRTIYQPASVVVHHLSLTREGLPDPAAFKKRQIVRNSQWMRARWGAVVDALHEVRLLAFYLPQFHPFVENDFWWGKGFTEWTNVTKARPNFVGHEQPHLPTELGFYDLRVPEVLTEQARLARAYGIHGFCFYYYWFHGKRLLDMPVERLLATPRADLPFCMCWANENWTRRWDGGEGECDVLVGQQHSDEDDEAVIRDLARFLRHPSYIRVRGNPMLLVYRAELFPDVRRTTRIWRDICRREGIGELHLVRVDSFENAVRADPPEEQGFDAAVEFPPHQQGAPIDARLEILNRAFTSPVHDYEQLALRSASYKEAGYLHYRSVAPRWDNTPRRQDEATIFARSTPGAYQAWLEEVLRYTREQQASDDRIVFVNAWNEWAEGAHLEPERRYGRSYLEATRNALEAHLVDPEA